jgi:hypothetical protein
VVIVFAATLLSTKMVYGFEGSSTPVSGGSTTVTLTATLLFTSLLFAGKDMSLISNVTASVTNVNYDPLTGNVTYDLGTTFGTPEFVKPTVTFNTLILIASLAFLIGLLITLIAHNSKGLTLVGTLCVIFGVIVIAIQENAFAPFTFSLISADGTKELFNIAVSWLSTGLVAVVGGVLSVIDCLIVLTKKKKI